MYITDQKDTHPKATCACIYCMSIGFSLFVFIVSRLNKTPGWFVIDALRTGQTGFKINIHRAIHLSTESKCFKDKYLREI